MTHLKDILSVLRTIAPEETALEGDPVGLLIGSEASTNDIGKIGVCLDATPEAAQFAVAQGCRLLIAHHPLLYHPLARIDFVSDPIARTVAILMKAEISLYAMHTNWDRATGGINDVLASELELQHCHPLGASGGPALARIGDMKHPRPLGDFIRFVDGILDCAGTSSLRFNCVHESKMISRVAVCGGAGAFLIKDVIAAGADAFVTSDVRHHEFLDAAGRNLALLDAGHDATETPGMRALAQLLAGKFAGLSVLWVGSQADRK